MKNSKPSFRFAYMIVGALFLATPNINLFDLLPDFIGYFLIAHALTYPADAFSYFKEAKEGFLKLMWISLSKVPAAIVMMSIQSQDNSQRAIVPVFSLCYAVLELIFLYPAFSALFSGIFYLGDRHSCEAAMGVPHGFGKWTRESLKKMTLAFFTLKIAMSTLPELSLISVAAYDPNTAINGGPTIMWTNLYPILAFACAVPVLVFGVLWYHYFRLYYRYLRHAKEADDLLLSHYAEKADHLATFQTYQRISLALSCLVAGLILGIDVTLDEVNIIPDFFSAIFLFLAVWLLKDNIRHSRPALFWCGAYTLTGLASMVAYYVFLSKFDLLSKYSLDVIRFVSQAGKLYGRYAWLSGVETLFAISAFISLYFVLRDVTEQIPLRQEIEKPGSTKRTLLLFCASGILSSIATFLHMLFTSYEHIFRSTWVFFWMIPLFLFVCCLISGLGIIFRLKGQIKDKMDQ